MKGEDERQNQIDQDTFNLNNNLNYHIQEKDNLEEKYYIKFPIKYIHDNCEEILDILLKGFDSWNTQEIIQYFNCADSYFYGNRFSSSLDERERKIDIENKKKVMINKLKKNGIR